MKKHLHKSLRALFLSLTVLLSLPMLAQKLNLKEVRLTDDVRELSLKESLGDISVPAPARHVVNNQAMKAPSRGENTNPYEAMAGEWIMTAVNTSTGATSEFNVIVHAVPEGDVGYNNTLYITGFHGYDWTVLTMTYNYNNETGSAEVAIIPGLFAEGVDFGLGGLNNVIVYNVVNNYLSTQPLIGEMSADSKTIDFGTNSLFGMIVNQDGSTTGYRWFWYTGIKMTKKSDLKRIKHNGVYYGLDTETNQATVMQNNDGEYAGEIVIPESFAHDGITYSVTSIGSYAFEDCSGLTSVSIPNSVKSIGKYAFRGCSGLTSITIPNSVTSIGDFAFALCVDLNSVHISDIAAWCKIEFTGVGSNPLIHAHHLYLNGEEVKDLVIPNTVKSIGRSAFEGCSGLTSVTIPNSVESIGAYAFGYCYGLTSLNIPNSVTSIASFAFFVCSGLNSITVESENSVYDSRNNCNAIIETATNTLLLGSNTTIIPNDVTSIENSALRYCSGLTSVTIPNSVTSIGSYAFENCSGLTSVTIGNSVTSIEWYAFAYCPELHDVYCFTNEVPYTEIYVFEGSYPENATLHVPAGSLESYRATEPWGSFGKIVALTSEETGIDELKGENGTENSAVFDLSGRRVQKAQKGIYIQNGKAVVK